MSDCSFATNALEIYDPVSNSWSNGAPMPTARFGAAAGVATAVVVVAGVLSIVSAVIFLSLIRQLSARHMRSTREV
jgi:hypothetical protein